ncbi:DUF87 domain-containing protein [Candidatus Parcubacteria bacterium]|nr:MAG: DUF87 domain-containing protein [Candidatus Parcubacteria bacterium]
MTDKTFYPAIVYGLSGKKYSALTGIRITSILDPALQEERESRSPFSPKAVDSKTRHLSFLQALAAWPVTVSIILQIVSRPKRDYPLGGSIKTAILLCNSGKEKKSITIEALNRHEVLLALLNNYFPSYEFQSVYEEQEVERILNPFPLGEAAAISRQRHSFVLTEVSSSQGNEKTKIGFLSSSQITPQKYKKEAGIPFVFPWHLKGSSDIAEIAEAMLWYPAPLLFQVRISPGKVSRGTIKNLEKSLGQCETLLNQGIRGEERLLLLQTEALRTALSRRLASFREPVFNVAVFLASGNTLDAALKSSVARLIAPGPDTDADLMQTTLTGSAVVSKIAGDIVKVLTAIPGGEPFTPEEAACAFRLPHPLQGSCPGLPIKRYRTALADPGILRSADASLFTLGNNMHRGFCHPVRMADDARMRHTCILGQTGTGKSTLIESMVVQDIEAGHGLCLIDPHGDLVKNILNRFPESRKEDLILIDFLDQDYIIPLNLLHWQTPQERDAIIDDLYGWMDMTYDMHTTGGPIFEQYFRGFMRLLMGDSPRSDFIPTMPDFLRIFVDRDFRQLCRQNCNDSNVEFMIESAEKASGDTKLESVAPYVTSKLNRFDLDTNLRRIVGQEKMALDFRSIMDTGKVVLMNLGRGKFGESIAGLVASQIVGRIKSAALSRIDMAEQKRRDFYLYVDEFQNVASESFVSLLSEARKFRLGLVLANQYTDQLEKKKQGSGASVLAAVLGNVGTTICFRLGLTDAERMAEVFFPVFNKQDLINLPDKGRCYVNFKSGGERPSNFSMQTILCELPERSEHVAALSKLSMEKYGYKVDEADRNIESRQKYIHKML